MLEAKAEVGVKVVTLVVELQETDPAIELPDELLSVKLIVLACTASLNVAVGTIDMATLVAPDAGVSLVTVGATAAAAAAVVNDQETAEVMGSPALSVAPLTVAVYVVELARAALGVRVAVLLELL